MVEGQGGDAEVEDVALDKGRCHKGPRVDERQLGDEVEIWDDNLRVRRPLAVSDGSAEDRLEAESEKADARHGREVYSGRHGGD